MKYYRLLLAEPAPKGEDIMNAGHVYFVMQQMKKAIQHYQLAQTYAKSHTDFIEKFNKDKNILLAKGLQEEEIQIMLDLLVQG